MKKQQYVIPMVRVVRVATTTHLCIGSPKNNDPVEGLDDVEPGGDDPGNFSRKRSVWDDEEEEQD